MSAQQSVVRDERTVAVEKTSSQWAYSFLVFALLIDVVYRGIVRHEAAWDLFALVMVASGISTVHQIRQKIWTRRWVRDAVLIACVGGVVAVVVVIVCLAAGLP